MINNAALDKHWWKATILALVCLKNHSPTIVHLSDLARGTTEFITSMYFLDVCHILMYP
jgi:hypothetical protein